MNAYVQVVVMEVDDDADVDLIADVVLCAAKRYIPYLTIELGEVGVS